MNGRGAAPSHLTAFPYHPGYLESSQLHLTVPTLTIVGEAGTRGLERKNFPLTVAELVRDRGSDWIEDSEARAFLERLARDEELQSQVETAWTERVAPFILQNEGAYRSDELRSTWTFTAKAGRLIGHHERRGPVMILTPVAPPGSGETAGRTRR